MAKAVLLVNLGSPNAPNVPAVRSYLKQFLMDPYVIQLPWILRKLIVSLFVLPFRPKASAAAYQSVWMEGGSPLIVLSEQLLAAVQQKMDVPVAMAMRYGQPSIEGQIIALAKQHKVNEIVFIPLYPHYADSTITTCVEQARSVLTKHNLPLTLTVIPPFYQDSDYINALFASAKPYLTKPFDHLVFSYHGLPESHIKKRDSSHSHCLQQDNCCEQANSCQQTCYRHQVLRTTACFVVKAGLAPDQYSVAFQSRLGRAKWLSPNTEDILQQLAQSGSKKILVICPAFVTDCLETLEEIAIRGQEVFIAAGGESLTLIPCLNSQADWVDTLALWGGQGLRST